MKVLVVEDDRHICSAVRRGLRGEGFNVDVAYDGNEGLWRAAEYQYDAIILDIMLPERNGYDVCRALRGKDIWTPILMLTAKDGDYDQAEALDLGADDYLTKPFSFVVLLARLRALIRRGAPARPAVLQTGDLRLDPGAHRCWRGDVPVSLTPREFALLEHLMRRQNLVASKSELVSAVWDENFDGDTNIVEVYVGYLRRKIDAPFGRNTIETVRGLGYRLDGGS